MTTHHDLLAMQTPSKAAARGLICVHMQAQNSEYGMRYTPVLSSQDVW